MNVTSGISLKYLKKQFATPKSAADLVLNNEAVNHKGCNHTPADFSVCSLLLHWKEEEATDPY